MKTLWIESSDLPKFNKKLSGECKTDVLIIGGGITGILCAYMLKKRNIDYMLIERERICGGVTGHTTAKITAQHALIYGKLVSEFGVGRAQQYYRANTEALARICALCKNIDCDFETQNSYVYSLTDKTKIERELLALQRIGANAQYARSLPLPFSVAGAVKFEHQAQFNPIKFIAAIAKELNIYEQTPARSFDGRSIITDSGKITAKKIIVATHFPFINKHGSYFLKMYQHRSYVLALENVPKFSGMYVDQSKTGLSFRWVDDLLLLGGGSHRTGKDGGSYNELEAFYKKHYPNARERMRWATQDCMTLDSVPYIGRYSKLTPNLYVATGFNKWGMTSSMAAATLLCDLVCGKQNEYQQLFSPSRSMLNPQLACNAAEAVSGLLSISSRRCPHLGCALKWNAQEHSWDCPCHGSRFSKDGKLLNNPANGDLK